MSHGGLRSGNSSEDDSSSGENIPKAKRCYTFRKIVTAPRRAVMSLVDRWRFRHQEPQRRQLSIRYGAVMTKSLKNFLNYGLRKTKSSNLLGKISPFAWRVPFTRWSRKLYGSKKVLVDEHERLRQAGKYIIHPFSNFRLTWDILSALLILANIVIIPMEIAFSSDTERHLLSIVFMLFTDVWFLVDIVLNFRTGVQIQSWDKTTMQLDAREIARWYLSGWFTVDLIASVPMDFIYWLFKNTQKIKAIRFLRIIKALAIFRIGRVPRLIRGIHHWEEVFDLQYDLAVSVLRFAYLILFLFLTCHVNGCLQYMVPMFYGFPDDSWVMIRGLHHPNVTWLEAYSWSLFKSTSHMLCIGYSQIIPRGMLDLWMTMYSQMSGKFFFALFIGLAVCLMEEQDSTNRAYRVKTNQIREYLALKWIPAKLRKNVLDYCEIRFQGKLLDEKTILGELNPILRREVVWFNTASLIRSVALFEDVSDKFTYRLGSKMEYAVYMPPEAIVRKGSGACHMFFISRGSVEIRTRTCSTVRSDGSHFGEGSLFSTEVLCRAEDVYALTTVHVYILHRSDYLKLLARNQEDAEKIQDNLRTLETEQFCKRDFSHGPTLGQENITND